jgi:hypothetical protein
MHQVKDERIKNEKVRAMFGNINKLCDFATRRRLDFIGHTLCQECKKLTKKLLTCWIRQARASGGATTITERRKLQCDKLATLKSNNLPVV